MVVGGSARWLKVGPLPAVHPAEFAKLALIVYLAHWFAKRGTAVKGSGRGTVPFLVIVGPIVALVLQGAGPGHDDRDHAHGVHDVLRRRRQPVAARGDGRSPRSPAIVVVFMKGYQLERIQAWLNPWADPAGTGFHTIQGLLALGLGGILGAGLGESRLAGGLFLPNAWNDFIFAIIGEEFGLIGAGLVIALFLAFAYAGIRTALGAPDTFGALLAAGITAWLCIQAFINIGVVVGLLPVTGITLPFVSAGGSSLIVSFAAVGHPAVRVARDGREREPWNDASADRGRRNGRAHLPGPRRRPVASRTTRRADRGA